MNLGYYCLTIRILKAIRAEVFKWFKTLFICKARTNYLLLSALNFGGAWCRGGGRVASLSLLSHRQATDCRLFLLVGAVAWQ